MVEAVGDGVREGRREREREGRDGGNTEKLSCGQRALGWSRARRTKRPVIFIFSLFVCFTLSADMSPFFLHWK